MNAQIIEETGRKEFAVVPSEDFLPMQGKIESYEDLVALRKAKADPANRKRRPLADCMRARGMS